MYRVLAKIKEDVLVKLGTFGTGSILHLWDILYRFHFVPMQKGKHKKMDLNITKLANLEANKAKEFLTRIDSKMMIDLKKSQVVENEAWLNMVEFTIPYIEKALIKQIKQIVTEEEIIKIELIKKVTVESVKHLSKNVNFVDQYDQNSGEVIPKKILNAYKEETFMTYENRFLFTLIRLIEDFIFLREKIAQSDFKGKNSKKATYEANVKLKKEKIRVNFEYYTDVMVSAKKTDSTVERIKKLKASLKMLKSTELYQILASKRVIPVKAPLKMTNVLLKNVNFQYAVKLWNYLSEQMEMKDKSEKLSKEYEDKGISKRLIDEDIFLMHLIFKNQENEDKKKGPKKEAIEDKETKKELTDALMERIIELNPELTEKQLKELIADKYMVMKTKRIISLKPVEDRFKERIDKYMNKIKEVRLK